jgi:serine/threonine protein kinase
VKEKVISEINILQQMNHMNIIQLYDYKCDGDYIFLIMEYCTEDLQKWMQVYHSLEEKKEMIIQITNGISYLHGKGILHRDIKPENILIQNKVIKICDFGFSVIMKEQVQLFQTICGTPLYMSPEIMFLKPYSISSEIWSLGILFYTLIYQIHPFGELANMNDYRSKIKNPISFEPNELSDILKHMLEYQPEQRPTIQWIYVQLTNKVNELKTHEKVEVKTHEKVEVKTHEKVEVKTHEKVEVKTHENEVKTHEKCKCDYIYELEEHIFQLESIIKEKEQSCCSCFSDNEPSVTGRGKTNSYSYDLHVDPNYFTPPSLSTPINIPKKSNSLSSSKSSSSSFGFFQFFKSFSK